ncbi:hypothetical protein M0805_001158 [Coniferiporia weirii]|nr:hypothetical protein M0805_001158 [Coniferiporia weirii]
MDYDINQAPESQAFLKRVAALPSTPGVSLDSVLAPSVKDESELRHLYAQDRQNTRLANPYIGLVSLFDAPDSAGIRSTRARVIQTEDDRTAKHLFPLNSDRRRKDGEPCVVETLDEFRKNWAIFTEGALSQLTDWNNVIAAGGSVLGCLLPISQANKESRRTMRKYFHSSAYPTSDIDLFLWGLNPEQAEVKINQIYEAVRDSVPWDATCVRTKHAISIHSQYPYRSVQIVLRLYHSPGEILAGFDVDAPCVAYDGTRVLANARSIVALMRQANTVDMTRRSPSYEVRLAKYASRGFEIYVPELQRADVDPTIFERSLARITGLARLLVLEKLARPEARVSYLESRRSLRSRAQGNTVYTRRMRRQRKGDLKADEEIVGLDMNDYDVATLHIPYGPGWTAKRIEKLVYQTDLGMNSTFNPKNKDRHLHRHVAFFGTMKECIEDLCEYCPEPKDDAESALQEEEDKQYVRGRIQFMEDDPGRQSMTGSFNPIDVGEWSELAYLGPAEQLFAAIAANDRAAVLALLTSDGVDISRRDHVGRTALHVAIMSAAEDVSAELIDAGVRMTARLADGRTALHLAAQMDMPTLVEKMLTRSAYNAEKAKEAEAEAKAKAASDEKMAVDDVEEDESDQEVSDSEEGSSEDEDSKKKSKGGGEGSSSNAPNADADIPDDNFDLPDVLDVSATDWDLGFTPLAYAIVNGSTRVVQVLLNAGADPKLATKANSSQAAVLHPLTLTLLQADDVRAAELIDQLVRGGASSAQADENLFSVFHALVRAGRISLVEKILCVDPSANAAINVPVISNHQKVTLPLVSAIEKGGYAVATLLLGHGARVFPSPEDVQKARNMAPRNNIGYNHDRNAPHELDYLRDVILPVEAALARHSYMVSFLIDLGAQVSVPIERYFSEGRYNNEAKRSLLDAVNNQVDELKEGLSGFENQPLEFAFSENPTTFAEYRRTVQGRITVHMKTVQEKDSEDKRFTPPISNEQEARRALTFFEEMAVLLKKANAKSFDEIFPDNPPLHSKQSTKKDVPKLADRTQYMLLKGQHLWMKEAVLPHLLDQYDALFEACWTGNNDRIEELCLPRKGSKSDKAPIQISVATEQLKVDRPASMAYRHNNSSDGVYTPFSVAILARNWATARLIVAIAIAQYKPKEDPSAKRFNPKGLILGEDDSDSDSDSDLSDDESMDVGGSRKEVGSFIDLASRSSAVQCDVSPKQLITYDVSSRVNQDGNSIVYAGATVAQACADGDLEAFVIICDIMQQLPEPQEPDMTCLLRAFESDSPEMVDEIIRRSGLGVNLDHLVASDDSAQRTGIKPSGKLYLGLTVHGKKRKDLARRVDGHASGHSEEVIIPLLWTAIQRGAKKVVEYFGGPGPLVAYRYYATTKKTEKADGLNKIQDLEKQLPALLGILPNSRQETALTAAILGPTKKKRLTMAKQVISTFHSQANTFLQSSIAFSRWTPMHLAVAENLEPAFLDYLFSNGLSAESTDRHGMNVYHIVCQLGHKDLLEYLLNKLPRDVTSHLLTQTTRRAEETPLMLAVLAGKSGIVDVLLQSGVDAVNECLTIRDAKGSMPLHAAVQRGFAKIASSLVKYSVDSEALHSENGVGETPIETATVRWLLYVTCDGFMGKMPNAYGQNQHPNLNSRGTMKTPGPLTKDKLVAEITLLGNVRTSLEKNGKLASNGKLKIALDSFIAYLMQKVAAPSDFTEVPATFTLNTDNCNREKTFNIITAATLASPGRRRLVHLVDVQRSVHTSLEGAARKSTTVVVNDYTQRRKLSKLEELPDEVDGEAMREFEQWKGVLKWGMYCRGLTRTG